MGQEELDDAFALYANQISLATADQIDEARDAQSAAASKGQRFSLSDMLVQQGVITSAQRDKAEKKLLAQRQHGGLKKLGPYNLIKKLGEGGMGAVYLAEDTAMRRKVAIKVLPKRYTSDAEFLSRFRREAKAAGKLNHPNIVGAFTVGEDSGNHFYVMEYCEGEPLDRVLKRENALPYDRSLGFIIQIARGLKYAHEHGIIHRDIKPANVFIAGLPDAALGKGANAGIAKILDLGLSKDIGGGEQSFNTQTGIALGTPHYISPEQARGEKNIDGRTDIYSLGATLYHLVTGETPFQGSTAAMIIMKHITDQIPNPQDIREDIPDSVVQIIQKMMAKESADRYAGCADLLADLELVASGQLPGSEAIDPGKSSIAMRRAPRRAEAPQRKGRTAGPIQPVLVSRHEPNTNRRLSERRTDAAVPSARTNNSGSYVIAAIIGIVVVSILAIFAFSGHSSSESVAKTDEPAPRVEPKETAKPKPPAVSEPQPAIKPPNQSSIATDDKREQFARRQMDEILSNQKSGAWGIEDVRQKAQELAERHSGTKAGKDAADFLKSLPPPARPTPSVWDNPQEIASLQHGHNFNGWEEAIWSIAFTPDSKTLATAGRDGNVRIWDVVSRKEMAALSGHDTGAWSVAISPDGKSLAARDNKGKIFLYGLPDNKPLGNISISGRSRQTLLFPDNQTLAAVTGRDIQFWELASQKPTATVQAKSEMNVLTLSQDRKFLAAGTDESVAVFELPSGKLKALQPTSAHGLAYSPDGRLLAAGADSGVTVWDTTTWKAVARFNDGAQRIWSLAFSPDGTTLVSGCNDTVVRIYDMATRQLRCSLNKHTSGVFCVLFSPDGSLLATAGNDGFCKIWGSAATVATQPVPAPPVATGEQREKAAQDALEVLLKFDGLAADDRAGRIQRLEAFSQDEKYSGTLAQSRARVKMNELRAIMPSIKLDATATAALKPGLLGNYYKNQEFTPENLALKRADERIEIPPGPPGTHGGAPGAGNNFRALWQGYLKIAAPGEYAFRAFANYGGVFCWIDGKQVFSNADTGPQVGASGSIKLSEGYHEVRFEHHHPGHLTGCQFFWTPPNAAEQVISGNVLWHIPSNGTAQLPESTVRRDVSAPDTLLFDQTFDLLKTGQREAALESVKKLETPAAQTFSRVLERSVSLHQRAIEELTKKPPVEAVTIPGKTGTSGKIARIENGKAWIKSSGLDLPVKLSDLPREIFVKALDFKDTPESTADRAAYLFGAGDLDGAAALATRLDRQKFPDLPWLLETRAKLERLRQFETAAAEAEAAIPKLEDKPGIALVESLKKKFPELAGGEQKARIDDLMQRAHNNTSLALLRKAFSGEVLKAEPDGYVEVRYSGGKNADVWKDFQPGDNWTINAGGIALTNGGGYEADKEKERAGKELTYLPRLQPAAIRMEFVIGSDFHDIFVGRLGNVNIFVQWSDISHLLMAYEAAPAGRLYQGGPAWDHPPPFGTHRYIFERTPEKARFLLGDKEYGVFPLKPDDVKKEGPAAIRLWSCHGLYVTEVVVKGRVDPVWLKERIKELPAGRR